MLIDAFDYPDHSDKVETKGKFFSKDVSRGNERRRWHGTKRTCNIGDEGKTQLCTAPSCSLCGIIKNSFDLSFSAKNTGFKRFGTGIYTSSTSSKFVLASIKRVRTSLDHFCQLSGRMIIRTTVASLIGRQCY